MRIGCPGFGADRCCPRPAAGSSPRSDSRRPMHPRLSLENTPACVEEIKALQACHADTNYWIKLLGACNEKKMVLDKCFRAQKKVRGWTMLEMSQHASSRARLMMAGQTKG